MATGTFSVVTLLTLLTVFAVSWTMFWLLARRSTTRRGWVALAEWGRDRKFRFKGLEDGPPALLSALSPRPQVRLCMSDGTTTLIQMEHEQRVGARPGAPGTTAAATPTAPLPYASTGTTSLPIDSIADWRGVWNVLVRPIEMDWPAAGLRPVSAPQGGSLLDLFSLVGFPALAGSDRFITYGTDSDSAAVLASSHLRSLLPPDIGLLLQGHSLMMDFSPRPFDTIEFERMLAIAEQLVAHLPAPV